MQAVILAGGRGTRLQRLFPDQPKALVPILGKPFLEWQIRWLSRAGILDIHLAGGYMLEHIRDWAERSVLSGVNLTLSEEPNPLGTAGGLKFVEDHVTSDPFYVLNGDSLMPNLDLSRLGRDFEGLEKVRGEFSDPWTTIAIAPIEESGRYGTVEFDDQGRITAFREKAERKAGWVNGGVYLMSRRALSLIEPGKSLSIETDVFPHMAKSRLLRAFKGQPPLLDMGTPEGIRAMQSYFASER